MSTAATRRYAEALADVAMAHDQVELIDQELGLMAQLFSENRELKHLFANPVIPQKAKSKVLEAILEKARPSQLTSRLLRLMLRYGRLHNIKLVYYHFRREVNERRRIVQVEVTTARPVSPPEQQILTQRLEQLTGKRAQISFKTDPQIIGGAIARIDSTIYDGSIRTQLEIIKRRIKELAAEI
jgi:F-type H+-transporting ATPase subunit delta